MPFDPTQTLFVALLVLSLTFDFLNGLHDSSNIVATVISSRALHPRFTLGIAAVTHFIGPFLFGVAVATTIGHELLDETALTIPTLLAALSAAVLWNLITWRLGIPSSSSHALLGGLLGSVVLQAGGLQIIRLAGLLKVVLALLISPLVGLLVGFLITRLVLLSLRKASPGANTWLRRLQILTLVGLGLSHGTNDAQKTMGILALGLLLTGQISQFRVPLWVVAISALMIALGTSMGGWRLIRTLGGKIYRIRPIHALSSQIAGASIILGAALLGGPVSTTQVMSSSIMGAGAAERMSQVRWGVLGDMVTAWLLTLPLTALISAGFYSALRWIL